jgi:hypothetical protein
VEGLEGVRGVGGTPKGRGGRFPHEQALKLDPIFSHLNTDHSEKETMRMIQRNLKARPIDRTDKRAS